MSLGSELLVESDASVESIEVVPDDVTARSPLELFWRRSRSDRVALVSAVFIVLLIVIAIAAPLVVSIPGPNVQDPNALDAFGSPTGASGAHPFGVDALGRDVMSRVIYGARASLLVGIVGTAIATLVGTVVGLLAGFYRRWTDTISMRAVDVFLSFPVLVLGRGIGAARRGSSGARSRSTPCSRPALVVPRRRDPSAHRQLGADDRRRHPRSSTRRGGTWSSRGPRCCLRCSRSTSRATGLLDALNPRGTRP